MSTNTTPEKPATAAVRRVNFSTTKRAPLTPLRAFNPTPARAPRDLKHPPHDSPTRSSPSPQEPLFLEAPETPIADLQEDNSDEESPVRRAVARTPRRIAVSDSESESSVADPSRRAARRIIDLTASDTEDSGGEQEDEEGQTQTWMDKYYDDSLGSLRDFIVDDSEDSEGSVGNESPVSSPTLQRKSLGELDLPDLNRLTIVDSSDEEEAISHSAPTPSKKCKKDWAVERIKIAEGVFADLDKRVFEGKLGSGGAGTASKQKNREANGTTRDVVKIMLSMKVCTGREQILSTVAHEMCHLATWIISKEMKNPHGRIFKSWGRKVMKVRKDIEVTTKHTYEIEYKFQWRCIKQDCGRIYQRHSKSIDIEKDQCSRCHGALMPMFETKRETAFQAYLKQNMSYAKKSMPGAPHGVVMRALASRWREAGPEADHLAYWIATARIV